MFAVVDLGFPVGGAWTHWGCGPPMWALLTENVCENERIGSHREGVRRARPLPDPPMVCI